MNLKHLFLVTMCQGGKIRLLILNIKKINIVKFGNMNKCIRENIE